MKLSTFILENIDVILQDLEHPHQTALFDTRGKRAFRILARKILVAIASDLQQKKRRLIVVLEKQIPTSWLNSVSICNVAIECSSLRANIMTRWGKVHAIQASDLPELVQFNEAMDTFINEFIARHILFQEVQIHQFNTMLSGAYYDDLTGLPNRRLLRDRLNQAIKHVKRENKLFALLSVDLDNFKHVNDQLGHEAGDVVLQEAGDRIRMGLRETDTVARMGGDEFIIILTNINDVSQAKSVAEKILKNLANFFQIEQKIIYISGSIGITFCPIDGVESDILLRNADQAMYAAKNAGRNCIIFYKEKLASRA